MVNTDRAGVQVGLGPYARPAVLASDSSTAVSVSTVATGAEEMTASIKEIAKNVQDARKIATTAVDVAELDTEVERAVRIVSLDRHDTVPFVSRERPRSIGRCGR